MSEAKWIEHGTGEFALGTLSEWDVVADPVRQFRRWFEDAEKAKVAGLDEMVLATADEEGRSSARMVLLKGIEDTGLVFVTNYESRKGRQVDENPWASVCVWWRELERQVRWEGRVERVGKKISEAIFRKRPRGSQIGAWASPQSAEISSRGELERAVKEMEKRFEGQEIPLPEHWGGFLVVPTRVEFWQGRASRLHDRLEYVLEGSGGLWRVRRLAP